MTTYKESGVDIDLANKSIEKIKEFSRGGFYLRTIYQFHIIY